MGATAEARFFVPIVQCLIVLPGLLAYLRLIFRRDSVNALKGITGVLGKVMSRGNTGRLISTISLEYTHIGQYVNHK